MTQVTYNKQNNTISYNNGTISLALEQGKQDVYDVAKMLGYEGSYNKELHYWLEDLYIGYEFEKYAFVVAAALPISWQWFEHKEWKNRLLYAMGNDDEIDSVVMCAIAHSLSTDIENLCSFLNEACDYMSWDEVVTVADMAGYADHYNDYRIKAEYIYSDINHGGNRAIVDAGEEYEIIELCDEELSAILAATNTK